MIGYKRTLKFILYAETYWFPGTHEYSVKSRVQELESHETHCRMKGKTQISWVSNEREKKQNKTLESRPSIDFNYLSLNWISNIIHDVLNAGRYDIEAHLAW